MKYALTPRLRLHLRQGVNCRLCRVARSSTPTRIRGAQLSTSADDNARANARQLTGLLMSSSQRIGRPLNLEDASRLSATLSHNWYDSVQALQSMPVSEAIELGVPSRLLTAVREELHKERVDVVTHEPETLLKSQQQALPDLAPCTAAPCAAPQHAHEQDEGSAVFGDPAIRAPRRFRTPTAASETTPGVAAVPSSGKRVRVTTRRQMGRYRLQSNEMTDLVQEELACFNRFLTQRFLGEQEPRVAPVTARKYGDIVRGALGWLTRERGVPLERLSLRLLVPDATRSAAQLPFAHLVWLTDERGIAAATEATVLRAFIALAKFLYHGQSRVDPAEGMTPYQDLEVVTEMRKLAKDAKARWRIAPGCADTSAKWLAWPEYLSCVEQLRIEASAGRDSSGRLRSAKAVAWSAQTYLLFAVLASVPDRQRTLRELVLGTTLRREPMTAAALQSVDGASSMSDSNGPVICSSAGRVTNLYHIRHTAKDYKTGKDYGERPPLLIPPNLSRALDAWADRWRAELSPAHNYFFTQKNGQPFSAESLYQTFSNTAWRLSGKKTNPHLIRDMVVTHLRSGDASERELEALAIYMGHSLTTQKTSYDRRTKAEKVAPAVALLQRMNNDATEV